MQDAITTKIGRWLFWYGWNKAALEIWLENSRQARKTDPTLIRKDIRLLMEILCAITGVVGIILTVV